MVRGVIHPHFYFHDTTDWSSIVILHSVLAMVPATFRHSPQSIFAASTLPCCSPQKLQRVTSSHEQVLAELEAANRDLQAEQNKAISLQNQLKLGSSSSIALAEVISYSVVKFQENTQKFISFKNCCIVFLVESCVFSIITKMFLNRVITEVLCRTF